MASEVGAAVLASRRGERSVPGHIAASGARARMPAAWLSGDRDAACVRKVAVNVFPLAVIFVYLLSVCFFSRTGRSGLPASSLSSLSDCALCARVQHGRPAYPSLCSNPITELIPGFCHACFCCGRARGSARQPQPSHPPLLRRTRSPSPAAPHLQERHVVVFLVPKTAQQRGRKGQTWFSEGCLFSVQPLLRKNPHQNQ